MTAQQHKTETTQHSMRRRGILTAAGIAVAGVLAKKVAQPVAATNTSPIYSNDPTQGSPQNTPARTFFIETSGGPPSTQFNPVDTVLLSIDARFSSNNTSDISAINAYGSGNLPALFGQSAGNGQSKAIYGHHTANGYGVYGDAGDGGYGVTGIATTALGVLGQSTSGTGVQGQIVGSTANTNAVYGANVSTGANGNGVYGFSAKSYGVVGYTTGGSASMSGISTNANIPAFAGGNSAAGGLAASFSGTVYVNGMFVVADMTQKHGLLKHPDGSHRLMYTVEAPESWAEDFGEGALVGGKAEVKLDPDFVALIHTDTYHVFLTSHHEEGNALAVTGRHADRFVVTEKAKGTSSGTFSWRVVAKPKTDNKVERMGKFTIPSVTLPDPAKLPKSQDTPLTAKR